MFSCRRASLKRAKSATVHNKPMMHTTHSKRVPKSISAGGETWFASADALQADRRCDIADTIFFFVSAATSAGSTAAMSFSSPLLSSAFLMSSGNAVAS